VTDRILLLLSEESLSVPIERMWRLVLELRPVPGSLSARAKIERALGVGATAVSFNRDEKVALLDALNTWLQADGFKPLGPDLIDVRGAIEYDLGVTSTPA
jgi:hypothetical protein